MRRIFVALGALVMVLLSACGASSGVVVDKSHTDEYYMYTYTNCGPKFDQLCPQLTYIPPSWSVLVRQDVDGKIVSSSVSETMFGNCPIGIRWVRENDEDGYCSG